jgi:hypothetical protein
MNENTLTVYIVNRAGIEKTDMQDMIEAFSGTLLASGTPEQISRLLAKREYHVINKPEFVAVGPVGSMPGTDGFTMAAFNATEVPIGTMLYIVKPQ